MADKIILSIKNKATFQYLEEYFYTDKKVFIRLLKELGIKSLLPLEQKNEYNDKNFLIEFSSEQSEFDIYWNIRRKFNGEDFIIASLMFYAIFNNCYHYSIVKSKSYELEGQYEYIKYLEKKEEISNYYSEPGPNEGNLKIISIIFITIIIGSFIFNTYVGSTAFAIYVILAIIFFIDGNKSKKERESNLQNSLKAIEAKCYGMIVWEHIKKDISR